MNKIERYRRLNLWNKIFFWAAIASLLALPLGLLGLLLSPDTTKITRLLENEFRKQLGAKDLQISFLQGQLELVQKPEEPSPRSRELAAQISTDADSYALALKAIAEKRFDEARKLLVKTRESKEVELSKVYEAEGQTESFARRYVEAVSNYKKALELRPSDPELLYQTANALLSARQYTDAETFYRRLLAISEQPFWPQHPNVGAGLFGLVLHSLNKYI